jgi:hypothetical protein
MKLIRITIPVNDIQQIYSALTGSTDDMPHFRL